MSKKNPLKSLIRDPRMYADFEAADGESDRAIAIIESSVLEDRLGFAIRAKFVELSDAEDSLLFDGTAPIATYSAKIRIAFALGLFDRAIQNDLHRLKDIRNAFAHSRRTITFDTPEIRAELVKLSVWRSEVPKNAATMTGRKIWERCVVRVSNAIVVEDPRFTGHLEREVMMRFKFRLRKWMGNGLAIPTKKG